MPLNKNQKAIEREPLQLKPPATFKRALERYEQYVFEHDGIKPKHTQIMIQSALTQHPVLHKFYKEEQKKEHETTRTQQQARQKVERAASEA